MNMCSNVEVGVVVFGPGFRSKLLKNGQFASEEESAGMSSDTGLRTHFRFVNSRVLLTPRCLFVCVVCAISSERWR